MNYYAKGGAEFNNRPLLRLLAAYDLHTGEIRKDRTDYFGLLNSARTIAVAIATLRLSEVSAPSG